MEIFPGINCRDVKCAEKRFEFAEKWNSSFIHIDVADGLFAPVKLFDNPWDLGNIIKDSKVNSEIHLMVEKPEFVVEKWITLGAKRIIVHAESINHEKLKILYEKIKKEEKDIEFGVSLRRETLKEVLIPYFSFINFFHFLAVPAGFSSQIFDDRVLEKINFLRLHHKNAKIEVDGGINEKTCKFVKKSGADIAVSCSFLFDSKDPDLSYEILNSV